MPSHTDQSDSSRKAPASGWRIADLVDFEFFLNGDENLRRDAEGEKQLEQRDRDLYIAHIEPIDEQDGASTAGTPARRRRIFHSWLAVRRKTAGMETLPGELFEAVQAQVKLILGFCGFIVGILDATAACYIGRFSGGREPANAEWYLASCVLLPAAFVLAAAFLFSSLSRGKSRQTVLFQLLAGSISSLLTWLMTRSSGLIDHANRAQMAATMGRITGRLKEHRAALKWPFFILLQSFGVAFALAVPLTTLLLNVGSERGFGWATSATNSITPALVDRVVRITSAPWRWLPYRWAQQPDEKAIAGSQVAYWPVQSTPLPDGARETLRESSEQSEGAFHSWWPYLVMCTVAYGLVPRLLLFALAVRGQRKALANLSLDDMRADRLFLRLTRPTFGPTTPLPGASSSSPAPPQAFSKPEIEGGRCLMLSSYDLKPVVETSQESLSSLIARISGWRVERIAFVGRSAAEDRKVLDDLARYEWKDERPRILCLQEAASPPIGEVLDFLRQCSAIGNGRAQVMVGLLGTPEADKPIVAPRTLDISIWQQKIDALANAHIGITPLVPS